MNPAGTHEGDTTTMARRISTPNSYGKHEATERLKAVSVALAVLEELKTRRWEDIEKERLNGPDREVDLSEGQVQLINDHFDLVGLVSPTVRSSTTRSSSSRVSVAECTGCGRWMMASVKWSKPASCVLSMNCNGDIVDAKPAKRL